MKGQRLSFGIYLHICIFQACLTATVTTSNTQQTFQQQQQQKLIKKMFFTTRYYLYLLHVLYLVCYVHVCILAPLYCMYLRQANKYALKIEIRDMLGLILLSLVYYY
jgi:hypothetical protein